MPVWEEIMKEIHSMPSSMDVIRRKYLYELSEYTGRNTIAYYSGWLQNTSKNLDINDNDMNGFMNSVYMLDKSKGLDLILHTPGGSPVASEAIVDYLQSIFSSDIRVIVPQLAMSAGTLIACSAKVIIMGRHSSLGPVDPQYNGVPAYNVVREFEQAKNDLQHGQNIAYWRILLTKYPPAFVLECENSIELSNKLLDKWLHYSMFNGDTDADEKITRIKDCLNEHDNSKNHGRHFNIDSCEKMGLKIQRMENNQKFQDLILSVHHAFMQSFSESAAVKIIENNLGKAFMNFGQKK